MITDQNKLQSTALIITLTLLTTSSAAFFGGGGGGGFFGGGNGGNNGFQDAVDDFSSGANDFANNLGEAAGDMTQDSINNFQKEFDRQKMKDLTETGGEITGQFMRDSSQILGKAGKQAIDRATSEQAMEFYAETAETSIKMGEQAYQGATSRQAQEFYGQVISDAQKVGESGVNTVTSPQAQEFYQTALEQTGKAGKTIYEETTDKEAQRFYRAAVREAQRIGKDSWKELTTEEKIRIYQEAFGAIQDTSKTVVETATSPEAQNFMEQVQFTLETTYNNAEDELGPRAQNAFRTLVRESGYGDVVLDKEISPEMAAEFIRRTEEHYQTYKNSKSAEQAKRAMGKIVQEARFAAELSHIFTKSAIKEGTEEMPEERKQALENAINQFKENYRQNQKFFQESDIERAEILKQVVKTGEQLPELDQNQQEKLFEQVIQETRGDVNLDNIDAQKIYRDTFNKIKWKEASQDLQNNIDVKQAEKIHQQLKNGDIEFRKLTVRPQPDRIESQRENAEEFVQQLQENVDLGKQFQPEKVADTVEKVNEYVETQRNLENVEEPVKLQAQDIVGSQFAKNEINVETMEKTVENIKKVSKSSQAELKDSEVEEFIKTTIDTAQDTETEFQPERVVKMAKWKGAQEQASELIGFKAAKSIKENWNNEAWEESSQVPNDLVPEDLSSNEQDRFKRYLSVASSYQGDETHKNEELKPREDIEDMQEALDYAKQNGGELPGGNGITGAFTRNAPDLIPFF